MMVKAHRLKEEEISDASKVYQIAQQIFDPGWQWDRKGSNDCHPLM